MYSIVLHNHFRFCNISSLPASLLELLNPFDHCTPDMPCQSTFCAFPEFPIQEDHLKVFVPVLCWWDEKWFTVAMLYLQACMTCETAGSPNCSTSGQDGTGVPDADFVVYVAARSFNCRGSTLAYAAHCFQDKTTDRYTHCSCYLLSSCVCLCVLYVTPTYACQHISLEGMQLGFGSLMVK